MVIPVTSTDTVTLSISPLEQLPLVVLRVSQSASSVADQSSVPSPEFCIPNVWPGGLDSPCSVMKLKPNGLVAIVGREGGGVGWPQPVNKLATSKATRPRRKAEQHQYLFLIFNPLLVSNKALFIEAMDLFIASGSACIWYLIQFNDDSFHLSDVKAIDYAILVGISPRRFDIQSDDDSFHLGDVKAIDYAISIGIAR